MIHELKCWPKFFKAMVDGVKTFEVRKNDRRFEVGDELLLREYDPAKQELSGQTYIVSISYILPGGNFGIDPDYVVLGIRKSEKIDHMIYIMDPDSEAARIVREAGILKDASDKLVRRAEAMVYQDKDKS